MTYIQRTIDNITVAVLGTGRHKLRQDPDWSDAVTNQRLIKAAYRSMAERREVPLAEMASEAATVA